jgi:hypothetical protein
MEVTFKACVKMVDDLVSGRVPLSDLSIVKGIGSNYRLESYYINTFATRLRKNGKSVQPGERLDYIVVKGHKDAKVGERMRLLEELSGDPNEIDHFYYLEKQLQKPNDKLFAVVYAAQLKPLLEINEQYIREKKKPIYGYKPNGQCWFVPINRPIELIAKLWRDGKSLDLCINCLHGTPVINTTIPFNGPTITLGSEFEYITEYISPVNSNNKQTSKQANQTMTIIPDNAPQICDISLDFDMNITTDTPVNDCVDSSVQPMLSIDLAGYSITDISDIPDNNSSGFQSNFIIEIPPQRTPSPMLPLVSPSQTYPTITSSPSQRYPSLNSSGSSYPTTSPSQRYPSLNSSASNYPTGYPTPSPSQRYPSLNSSTSSYPTGYPTQSPSQRYPVVAPSQRYPSLTSSSSGISNVMNLQSSTAPSQTYPTLSSSVNNRYP